jgi:RNA 2',3'-cyclic 3'-phosphodiesterase
MRVFVAVEISDEARRLAAERIEFLRQKFPHLRVGWERPEKLHLTLKFLGDMTENQLGDLKKAVDAVAGEFASFEIAIADAGAFPPRVLWLGVKDKSQNLAKVQTRIETETALLGFEREQRHFNPHLTLARLKEPEKSRALADLHKQTDFDAVSFEVSQIVIFNSELRPTGSVYTPLYNKKWSGNVKAARTDSI